MGAAMTPNEIAHHDALGHSNLLPKPAKLVLAAMPTPFLLPHNLMMCVLAAGGFPCR